MNISQMFLFTSQWRVNTDPNAGCYKEQYIILDFFHDSFNVLPSAAGNIGSLKNVNSTIMLH